MEVATGFQKRNESQRFLEPTKHDSRCPVTEIDWGKPCQSGASLQRFTKLPIYNLYNIGIKLMILLDTLKNDKYEGFLCSKRKKKEEKMAYMIPI